jgi:lipoprotein-releasing system permease protein
VNIYFFISSRINKGDKRSFSATVRVIATFIIALGIAVILVSFAVLGGFKKAIKEKIFNLGGHIQVVMADNRESYEENPFANPTDFYKSWKKLNGIEHVQPYMHKAGLLQTKKEIHGVILKGVDQDYRFKNLEKNLVEGKVFSLKDSTYTRDVVISRKVSEKLGIKIKDTVWMYFLQNPPRYRKLAVCGIYETGLEEFDDQIIFGDIRMIRGLNQYSDSIIGGYEVFVKDFDDLEENFEVILEDMDYFLSAIRITDKYPQVFDWLELVDRNVWIFLVLIILVSCFIMVSGVFIMIVERTNMIGLLKAIGATNQQIGEIFFLNGMGIILKGMLIGNVVAMVICFLQYQFHLIPLDKANYYMDAVPISWSWLYFVALNFITLLVVTIVLVIPVVVVSFFKPIRSIRFN